MPAASKATVPGACAVLHKRAACGRDLSAKVVQIDIPACLRHLPNDPPPSSRPNCLDHRRQSCRPGCRNWIERDPCIRIAARLAPLEPLASVTVPPKSCRSTYVPPDEILQKMPWACAPPATVVPYRLPTLRSSPNRTAFRHPAIDCCREATLVPPEIVQIDVRPSLGDLQTFPPGRAALLARSIVFPAH